MPRAPRDLVILSGPEPAYRWRTFCATVIELAEALGVQLVVTLGALLADVPHSRPVGVTAFATDEALVERLKLEPPTYEGPTGIVGVLHDACANAGHAERVAVGGGAALRRRRARTRRARWRCCAGSRASSGSPSTPPSSRTRRASTSARSRARSRWTRTSRRSSRSSSAPPTRRRAGPIPSQLPSGDVLAREFQRFLRQRGNGPA